MPIVKFASRPTFHILLAAVVWSAALASVRADDAPAVAAGDVQRLAALIDGQIATRWKADGVEPAPPADDAEFLRRTWLNIAGRIPPASAVREFLADSSPDKRTSVVEELLASPAYASHFADVWRSVMLPEAEADLQQRALIPTFESWLRQQFVDNAGYDQMARALLTAPVGNGVNGPSAFFQAKEFKPENLAAATSRVLLGVRLECAQCHNHPFAHWQQEEFWGFAALFAGIAGNENGRVTETVARKELKIPDTNKTVQARFLDGAAPLESEAPRNALAAWLTDPRNPYFAPAAVNRIWANFFGLGIVQPVDDFDENNQPSHPELLDLLSEEFASHNFDVKFLVRAITSTKTYQLSSRQTHPGQAEERLFARMAVKAFTPEQLFDSLAQATGYYETEEQPANVVLFQNNSVRAKFLELFTNDSASPTEAQTSILQALALMNGEFVSAATTPAQSTTLAAVVDAPFLTMGERIEALYLVALGRMPQPEERAQMTAYVEGTSPPKAATSAPEEQARAVLAGGSSLDDPRSRALGDVFWALLNSSEFLVNH